MYALIEKAQRRCSGLLRVTLGVMFLAHSVVLKLFTFGLAGTAGYFASIGLPGGLAYVVFAAEADRRRAAARERGDRLGVARADPGARAARSGCTPAMAGCSAPRVAAGNTRCS